MWKGRPLEDLFSGAWGSVSDVGVGVRNPEMKSIGKTRAFQCNKLREYSQRLRRKLLFLPDNLDFVGHVV